MMKRIEILLIGLLIAVGPIGAHLQGVVLNDMGEPMIGANVYWAGTTTGTATDDQGVFEIELVRETKSLVISYLGYRNDTIVVSNRDLIKVVLVPDDLLDEVVISQRKWDVMRSRFSAFDVQTIGQGQLCKLACCNLSEAFETSAAVDVAYADAATGMHQIRMLGLSGLYVQLLNENGPASHGLLQPYGLEYIPGTWIESVQISKGTSSVLNGFEALTGQINVEYLKPQKQAPLDLNVFFNTDLGASIDLAGGWDIPIPKDPMLGTLSTGLLAHYENCLWATDDNRDGFMDMPTCHNLNVLNRWYYKNDAYSFQFLMRGLHDERVGGQREVNHPTSINPAIRAISNPYHIQLQTNRVDGFMKHGVLLNEESNMSLGITMSAAYHQQQNTYGTRIWNATQANAYLNAIFQNTWEGGDICGGGIDNDHQLSAGFSINYDRYWEELNIWSCDLNRQEVTPGVFAEYTYKIEEQFSMVAGVRADWSSHYGLFCTPRLNVRYSPFAWWTIRASAGLGYRSPNVIADYASLLPSNRKWTYLNPHQERSVNAGVTATFDIPIGTRTLQLTAEYYYTRFLDGTIADLDSNRYAISFYNLSEVNGAQSYSHSAQIEASMEILKGWTMTAAFRYTDVRQTTWNALTNQGEGGYQLREKALQNRFKAVVSTSYQTPKKTWQFDITAQFNGPGRMYDGFVIPEGSQQYKTEHGTIYHKWYPQLMAQITKFFPHDLTLYVGAENMTNLTQDSPVLGNRLENGLINATDEAFDASTVWAPITGWKVYIGLNWTLNKKEKERK